MNEERVNTEKSLLPPSPFAALLKFWPYLAKLGQLAEAQAVLRPEQCPHTLQAMGQAILNALRKAYLADDSDTYDSPVNQLIHLMGKQRPCPPEVYDSLQALLQLADKELPEYSAERSAGLGMSSAYLVCQWLEAVFADQPRLAPDYALPARPEIAFASPEDRERAYAEFLDGLHQQVSRYAGTPPQACLDPRLEPGELHTLGQKTRPYRPLKQEQKSFLAALLFFVNVTGERELFLSYALCCSRIPVISELVLVNDSYQDLGSIKLTISSPQEIFAPFETRINAMKGDSSTAIRDPKFDCNLDYLTSLTETAEAKIDIEVRSETTTLEKRTLSVRVFTYDQCHGWKYMPELLGAFVMPNHPEVTKIVTDAAKLLEKWTGSPSLTAYQSGDPNQVLQTAAAVYGALQQQNIVYAPPPANFDFTGQRLRLPETIAQQKMGTCADLSLLYAACLEAVNLHPIIITIQGHMFVGVWLIEAMFAETVVSDPSQLTNRIAAGVDQITCIESTSFTAGKTTDFDTARRQAASRLCSIDDFLFILDITRARLAGIRPMPMRVMTDSGWKVERPKLEQQAVTAAPQQMLTPRLADISAEETPASKKAQWERKLLDLSMRNTLLNLRWGSAIVPLFTSSADTLEDFLADGEEFHIQARSAEMGIPGGGYNFENMQAVSAKLHNLLEAEFKNRRLYSAHSEGELRRTLTNLYRASQNSLEENGANTLFMALGMVRWYESDRSDTPRFAPILLLPIDIIRKSAAQGYALRLRDDEPQLNITMLEKFKQDFQLNIGGLDPLPLDEHGLDTRLIFTTVRCAIMGQPRWDVLESVCLGIFSFSQFVMWNDIRSRGDDLAKNKIVRSLMEGKLCWEAEDIAMPAHFDEGNTLLPIQVDGSQLRAIQAANEGCSFVLHGPPGTGKSQTITALIANALAQGKTVLFVAEKMAALQVVHKRLKAMGLGPFCLELHSNTAQKSAVLGQLESASNVVQEEEPAAYAFKSRQLASLRNELDAYGQALHQRYPCGLSLFDIINLYLGLPAGPEIPWHDPQALHTLTQEQLSGYEPLVRRLILTAQEIGHPYQHPLAYLPQLQYSRQLEDDLRSFLPRWLEQCQKAQSAFRDFAQALQTDEPQLQTDFLQMLDIGASLEKWLNVPKDWLNQEHPNFYLGEVQKFAKHHLRCTELRRQLLERWNEEFLKQDPAALLAELNEIESKYLGSRPTEEELRGLLPYWKEVCQNAKEAFHSYAAAFRTDEPQLSENFLQLLDVGANLDKWLEAAKNWLSQEHPSFYLGEVQRFAKHQLRCAELRQQLLERWNKEFLNQDPAALLAELDETEGKWMLARWSGSKNLLKKVQGWAKGTVSLEDLRPQYQLLRELREEESAAAQMHPLYAPGLGSLYMGEATDWQTVHQEAQRVMQLLSQHADAIRILSRWSGSRKLLEKVRNWAKAAVSMPDLRPQYQLLRELREEESAAAQRHPLYAAGLGHLYMGEATDWQMVHQEAQRVMQLLNQHADDSQTKPLLERYGGRKELLPLIEAARQAYNELLPLCQRGLDMLNSSIKNSDAWLTRQMFLINSLSQHLDELKAWSAWCKTSTEAEAAGLAPLVAAYRQGLAHDEVMNAGKRSFYKNLALSTIEATPVLDEFRGLLFNEQIEQFQRLDQELRQLTRQEIYCKLSANVPNFTKEASKNSEIGILQKAIRSKGRGISLRKLFDRLPNILHRICPCMLMSPLSVAQYIDPCHPPFDLVVFDEASQMQTCKAIGALARARDAVIVGDPKQMPPTNFFSSSTVDEDNLELEDLESILEDCLALRMPQTHLLWHYRSRHESLIAFSNQQFYENKLFTFPSSNARESKVTLHHVDGVFERGKKRANPIEAQAVVEELKRRAQDPILRRQSVGIVTFNIAQQTFIDDLFMEACQKDSSLENWAFNAEEPLFIKNLENVQGDERDVIIFSIGYGPDELGRVTMNFGPLNRDGGWRRLNVAVSRARWEMTVFTSLWPEQISTARTRAAGVHALRAFLEFAHTQNLPPADDINAIIRPQREELSRLICSELQKYGYSSDLSVGHSEYKIDIGVIDNRHPQRYLLGILLDGPAYERAQTTRDRELGQRSVLQGLGWQITRIWSLDWWENPQRELNRLLQKLQEAAQALEEQEKAEAEMRAQAEAEMLHKQIELQEKEEAAKTAAENARPLLALPEFKLDDYLRDSVSSLGMSDPLDEADLSGLASPSAGTASAKPQPAHLPVYRPAELPEDCISNDMITCSLYDEELKKRIASVLEQEAPISRKQLQSRVAKSAGLKKVGPRLAKHLDGLLQDMKLPVTTLDGGQDFFWKPGQNPIEYRAFRVSGTADESKRAPEDISEIEIANAIVHILTEQISLPDDALRTEVRTLMGFGRLTPKINALLSSAMLYAAEQERIQQDAAGSWILA